MSLDIGVGDGSSFGLTRGEPSLSFEDGASYWFLHPLFEKLQTQTGQYIDLYGRASFAGEQLAALKQVLTEARRLVESQPNSWKVHVGTQVLPCHQELYRKLDRGTLLNLIASWECIVMRAEQSGNPVVCIGD